MSINDLGDEDSAYAMEDRSVEYLVPLHIFVFTIVW